MKICFVGHGDTPNNIEEKLEQVLEDLINNYREVLFYVGDHGQFDALTRTVLRRLQQKYNSIQTILVLSYMPTSPSLVFEAAQTLLPEEVARAHPRYAIDRRNRWVIDKSDIVVTYVTRSYGGAAKFKKLAIARGKKIIEIAK